IVANVIMFVPLGFLLPLVFKRVKPVHSVFICLAVTCVIEVVQPVVGRTGDLDDVIANFLGGVLGAVTAAVVIWILKKRK
ncbi:MAG: VanZ family protein, partial [Ruminiclostridium sp.]|nr:VanZ family protein [Ruminiclostridium sp.]